MKANRHMLRMVMVFDQDGQPVGKVLITIYHSDAFKWDLIKTKGWKALVVDR